MICRKANSSNKPTNGRIVEPRIEVPISHSPRASITAELEMSSRSACRGWACKYALIGAVRLNRLSPRESGTPAAVPCSSIGREPISDCVKNHNPRLTPTTIERASHGGRALASSSLAALSNFMSDVRCPLSVVRCMIQADNGRLTTDNGQNFGRLAQLVRASRLHRESRGFESLIAHFAAESFVLSNHDDKAKADKDQYRPILGPSGKN